MVGDFDGSGDSEWTIELKEKKMKSTRPKSPIRTERTRSSEHGLKTNINCKRYILYSTLEAIKTHGCETTFLPRLSCVLDYIAKTVYSLSF